MNCRLMCWALLTAMGCSPSTRIHQLRDQYIMLRIQHYRALGSNPTSHPLLEEERRALLAIQVEERRLRN